MSLWLVCISDLLNQRETHQTYPKNYLKKANLWHLYLRQKSIKYVKDSQMIFFEHNTNMQKIVCATPLTNLNNKCQYVIFGIDNIISLSTRITDFSFAVSILLLKKCLNVVEYFTITLAEYGWGM